MKVEERTPLAIRSGLMEAIAWRWTAEWFRRHPEDLWLRRISSPEGDVLRVFVVGPTYQGHHADLPLTGNQAVRIYTSDWQFEAPRLTQMALESESPHEVVDELCADLELACNHSALPDRTPRGLAYGVIAGLLAFTAFEPERWECATVAGGAPGSAAPMLREDLLEPFGHVRLSAPRFAYPPAALEEEAFGWWAITRNGEPRILLSEKGVAHFRDGQAFDFFGAFREAGGHKESGRMALVVAALGERVLA